MANWQEWSECRASKLCSDNNVQVSCKQIINMVPDSDPRRWSSWLEHVVGNYET